MSTLLGPGGQSLSAGAADATVADDGAVIETTTETFARDVIEASRSQVVLVDFWAPWCGPCKQLAPVLEKVVRSFRGAVTLVKMNIDEHPQVAGQLGIRSIPAVIAFRQGQPLDGFMGAQSEGQVRAFVERVAGPATDGVAELLQDAEALRAAGDLEQATMAYSQILQIDPENAEAIAGLGMVSVAAGNIANAKALVEQLPPELRGTAPIKALESSIALAEQAASLGGAAALKRDVEANPDNHEARYDLAVALAGEGDRLGAVDELVEILRRDREWNDNAARTQLVTFFEAWGPKDPATLAGRRKMASVLFA